MKTRLVALTAVTVALLVLSSCSSNVVAGKDVTVDGTYHGKEIEVPAGAALVVVLESNPSTGFAWSVASSTDPVVLKEKGHMFEATTAGTPPLVGASGKDVWTFTVLNKGKTTLSMEYSQPWEGGMKRARTFVLNVTGT